MKSELIYGIHTVIAALENNPLNIIEVWLQEHRDDKMFRKIFDLTKVKHVKVVEVAKTKMNELIGHHKHQGVIAVLAMTRQHQEDDLLNLLHDAANSALFLVLDGVQDPHNLGACLRTANAAGVTAVIVPKDKAVGLTSVVHKVACGAAETTPFIQVTNLARTLKVLQNHNVWIYGADAEAELTVYHADLTGNVALVLGAEGRGLRRLTKENCDELINIPMVGDVSSLNVSVATGICLFEVVRRRIGVI